MHALSGCFVGVGVAAFDCHRRVTVVNVVLPCVAFDFVKGDAARSFSSKELEEEPLKVAVWLQIPWLGEVAVAEMFEQDVHGRRVGVNVDGGGEGDVL